MRKGGLQNCLSALTPGESELRSSYNKLSDLAHDNTRRFDTLYYSTLEKVGVLHSTISSLQELSAASNQLRDDFHRDTRNLEGETQSQIAAFKDFETQQGRVRDLESRIKAGMSNAKGLSERLEAARARVALWDEREKRWQAKTSSEQASHDSVITSKSLTA